MRAASRLVLSAALAAASALPCACAPPREGAASAAEPARLEAAGAGAGWAREGFAPEPYFDAVALAPGALSLALTGSDPGAPRALGLWRSDRGSAGPELLRVTASDPQGRFDFGQWLVPKAGAEWTVAPIDTAAPHSTPASSRLHRSLHPDPAAP